MKRLFTTFSGLLSLATVAQIEAVGAPAAAEKATQRTGAEVLGTAAKEVFSNVRMLLTQQPPYQGVSLLATNLLCEGFATPLGLDLAAPRLSWKVESNPKQTQSAYRILVASDVEMLASDTGDLWDSDKVESTQSARTYEGHPLVTDQECWWKVKVWDATGQESAWSAPARWEMGLLSPEDWAAEWIGFDAGRGRQREAAPMGEARWITQSADNAPLDPRAPAVLLSELTIPETTDILSAVFYATAEGRFRIFINGRLLSGDGTLEECNLVTALNATPLLKSGVNTIRVESIPAVGDPQRKGFLGRLVVSLPGGRTVERVTDETWRTVSAAGPDWATRRIDLEPLPGVRISASAPDAQRLEIQSLSLPPAVYLRHEFTISKPVRKAKLHVCSLGLVDMLFNGSLLRAEALPASWPAYQKYVDSKSFDVTALLKEGPNAIGAVLTDGWFCGYSGFLESRERWGKMPQIRVELHLEFEDGSAGKVLSNGEWKADVGPLQQADPVLGEYFDARAEQRGWSAPGFDATRWKLVSSANVKVALTPRRNPHPEPSPVAELSPVNVSKISDTRWVLDLGRQFRGTYKLNVKAEAGTEIRMRFAKKLNAEGVPEFPPQREGVAQDTYVCKGDVLEHYSPRFSVHDYRFVEISGLTEKPAPDTFTGIAVSNVPIGEEVVDEAPFVP